MTCPSPQDHSDVLSYKDTSKELSKCNLFSLQMNTGLNTGTKGEGWEGARGVFCKQTPIGSGCYAELGCICHIWLDCLVLFYLPDLNYDSSGFMWHFLGNITAWIIYPEHFPNHKASRLQRVYICIVIFWSVFLRVLFNVALYLFNIFLLVLLVKRIHEAFWVKSYQWW